MLSHGEASAAVADCLAAGLPTVVSDLGWASELSADVVAHVPSDVLWAGLAARIRRAAGRSRASEIDERTCTEVRGREQFSATARQYLRCLTWYEREPDSWIESRTSVSGETPDFSTRLHDLRTAELRRLPVGARTVLHGGAAGAWYFEWFDKNYPGDVERHIGVEAFADRPPDLPANVQWLAHTAGDMESVPSGSVDMVFGGQVIERLSAPRRNRLPAGEPQGPAP